MGILYNNVRKFNTIKEMLDIATKESGEKIAFKYKKNKEIIDVKYKEFDMQTKYLGAALTEKGFGNKHISCIGNNSYNWIVVYLTVLKSAGVFVPIDKELLEDNIFNIINESEAEVVFYTNNNKSMFLNNSEKLLNVKLFVNLDDEENINEKFLSFNKLIEFGKKCNVERYEQLKTDPNDLKLLVYTSGTTGIAKGVMLSEHNLVSSIYYGLQVANVYDICLSVLPYHHTYEAVCNLLVSLNNHSTICINDSLKDVVKNLEVYKPSYIYLVPAFVDVFYNKILKTIKSQGKEKIFFKMIDISNFLRKKMGIDLRKIFFKDIHKVFGGRLIKIVSGGAPIRKELGEFFDDIGIKLINGYGITECSPLVSVNQENFNDCGTVGIPLKCIELKINNPNDENIGEICVKGDIVMLGYYKKLEKTVEVLKDGWFYTGDYGYINDKGQLIITGREKNIIVLSNGKNIYPEELENYIQSLDYISEVIVKSDLDEKGEQKSLIAEVFLNEEKTQKEILADIRKILKQLPTYKQIQKIIIRDSEFKKNTSNKILRY